MLGFSQGPPQAPRDSLVRSASLAAYGCSEYPETAPQNETDYERPALVRMCSRISVLDTNRCRWRNFRSPGVYVNCAHTPAGTVHRCARGSTVSVSLVRSTGSPLLVFRRIWSVIFPSNVNLDPLSGESRKNFKKEGNPSRPREYEMTEGHTLATPRRRGLILNTRRCNKCVRTEVDQRKLPQVRLAAADEFLRRNRQRGFVRLFSR